MLTPSAKSIGLSVGCNALRHARASLLLGECRDVKQVSEWLRHADPGFTLRTYVHLMDGGAGDADFIDAQGGSSWVEKALQTAVKPAAAEMA